MKYIKFLKEYLPLIIIIAPFFGGIWQIIELSSMSMSYVRFFSITQLIADGLLIIIVVVPFVIGIILFLEQYNSIKNNNSEVKNSIFINIFLFVIGMVVLYVCIDLIFLSIIKDIGINTYFGYLMLIVIIYLILSLLLVLFQKSFIKFSEFIIKMYKTKLTIFSIMVIISFFVLFHNMFFMPNNLENIINLPDRKIRYFNDKYIFMENKKDKNILVIKFDKLFKEE